MPGSRIVAKASQQVAVTHPRTGWALMPGGDESLLHQPQLEDPPPLRATLQTSRMGAEHPGNQATARAGELPVTSPSKGSFADRELFSKMLAPTKKCSQSNSIL